MKPADLCDRPWCPQLSDPKATDPAWVCPSSRCPRLAKALVERYEMDPSSPYSMTLEECHQLLGELGELEPIIDAILKKEGQSIKARAEAIGVHPSDFGDEG